MRYLSLTDVDRRAMLDRIGVAGIDDLFSDVPAAALLEAPLELPDHAGEMEVERALSSLATGNLVAGEVPFFLGAGAYRHHLPATVGHLVGRSEFLTSYTPYQPEISQGTLQYLFEFQTQVAALTGMEVANASMYDGSTACAEAVLMARRVTKRRKVVVSGGLHPHYLDVIRTMTRFTGDGIEAGAPDPLGDEALGDRIDDATSCVVVQTPDLFGHLHDLTPLAEAAHAQGALLVAVTTEAVSLGALRPPGAMGADIFAGEGQAIGNPLSFGGPYLGLFATRTRYVRQMPGRLVGETVDTDGRRGYVLTLSTREQHIRREKATSNICTNSGLCALSFCIHLALLGEAGLTGLAALNHAGAVRLAERLAEVAGVEVLNESFFNEFTIRLLRPAGPVIDALAAQGILGGVPLSRLYPGDDALANLALVTVTETCAPADMDALVNAMEKVLAG